MNASSMLQQLRWDPPTLVRHFEQNLTPACIKPDGAGLAARVIIDIGQGLVHMTNEGDAVEEETVYSLPSVPWCSFFTSVGNAFHGTYWHNDYGRPRSHGCVNLPNQAARFIYRWTIPVVPPDEDYVHEPGVGISVHIS